MSPLAMLMAFTALLEMMILLLIALRWRSQALDPSKLAVLEKGQERLEGILRNELAQMRQELQQQSHLTRHDLLQQLADARAHLLQVLDSHANGTVSAIREMGAQHKDLLDAFSRQLAQLTQMNEEKLEHMRGAVEERLVTLEQENSAKLEQIRTTLAETLDAHYRHTLNSVREMGTQQKELLDSFSRQLTDLTQMNEQKLNHMRETVEQRLSALQQENSAKLDEMRAVVDEKLHQTLEQRLGESFKLVSERLEQVHKGLGEMQSLAAGVGDLKRVLSNIRARGTLGEIQLDGLLQQILSPEQYRTKVEIRPGSGEQVDFAIVLPGKDESGRPVLLPIDAKFPLDDYQHLVEAEAEGNAEAALAAARALEQRIKTEARSIRDKYLDPPNTTDFAILFLPLEPLYAEVLRRPGLWEALQREFRVVVAGPTTIAAFLNSLQMGFRTLAIQRRASEVWKLLGAIKTEFGKFGEILERTQKKLQEASNTIENAAKRSRGIERKLKEVEALPSAEAQALLSGLGPLEDSEPAVGS